MCEQSSRFIATEPYLFISYSHQEVDAEFLYRLVDSLEEKGINLWCDRSLNPGKLFTNELTKKIMGCTVFMPLVSDYSNSSNWCMFEVNTALNEHLSNRSRIKNIVPVFYGKPSDDNRLRVMMENFQGLQYEKYHTHESFVDALVNAVSCTRVHCLQTEDDRLCADVGSSQGVSAEEVAVTNCNKFLFEYSDELPEDPALVNLVRQALSKATVSRSSIPYDIQCEGSVVEILGKKHRINYKEMYGSAVKGVAEFSNIRNISFTYTGCETDTTYKDYYAEIIPDFSERYKTEEDHSQLAGYGTESLPKLRLNSITAVNSPRTGNPESLSVDFGVIDYFTHRIARKWLMREEHGRLCIDGQREYLDVVKSHRVNMAINGKHWAMCGCGAWIVTKDDMLIVSHRTNVMEEIGKLGYSSAGGCDQYLYTNKGERINQYTNPFEIIMQETIKEVGLKREHVSADKFRLVSLGLDLSRCLVQFSFFLRIDIHASDVLNCFNLEAQSSQEQEIFFVPFRSEPIHFLISSYEMESGAAFSLLRCLSKGL